MRSPREILFRFRQEVANAALWQWPPPRLHIAVPDSVPGLPDPESIAQGLCGTTYEDEIVGLARRVTAHEFPILGVTLSTGPDIAWRRDYVSGKETNSRYFRRIPYLDFHHAGDHKVVWELNRHQHLVLLAQAFVLTGSSVYLDEIWTQLESWLDQNPFQSSINWASALEVAFRGLSWMWVHHLVGWHMPRKLRVRFLTTLYRHAWHLEYNISYYFSRNTHLLGEAVALHALGRLFENYPRAAAWVRIGAEAVRSELDYQVLEDGAHFEQSTYYHVYALDFFTFHYILAERPLEYRPVLSKMADYLHALLGPAGSLPFLGDDDGGRLFYPYGDHSQFARATLGTCSILLDRPEWLYQKSDLAVQAAWWLGEEAWRSEPDGETRPAVANSRIFPNAGIAVFSSGDRQVTIDAGPFGPGRAGHSHSDCLNVVVREGGTEILVDAGTFTYVGEPALRNWFRGSAAHNVVRVNERDQAEPHGPFGWVSKPEVHVLEFKSVADCDFLDAECRYSDVRHRRRVLFLKPALLVIIDDIFVGVPLGNIEQIWHFGADVRVISDWSYQVGSHARLTISPGGDRIIEFGGRFGWRSRVFGQKEEAYALAIARPAVTSTMLAAAIDFTDEKKAASLELVALGDKANVTWACDRETVYIQFGPGIPEWNYAGVR